MYISGGADKQRGHGTKGEAGEVPEPVRRQAMQH